VIWKRHEDGSDDRIWTYIKSANFCHGAPLLADVVTTKGNDVLNRNACSRRPNGWRYLRWGGDGEAVQLEKGKGVETA
jgi:hypothetical protein